MTRFCVEKNLHRYLQSIKKIIINKILDKTELETWVEGLVDKMYA